MDGTTRAIQYADGVLDGSIAAPELVKLACRRFVADRERDDITFREDVANDAIENIELLEHVKGRWQGEPVRLEPWQCFIVANLFGFVWKGTKRRRFRYGYIQVPRKNGKSFLAICIALQLFAADDEPGAEVYLGATGQDQARDLLFLPAKRIAEQCKEFREHYGIEVNASTLVIPDSFSRLKSVIKKPDDGYSPHGVVIDEYHEHEDASQFDTFNTGMGAREQPLMLVTTTAGSNLAGPCKEYRDDCVRVLEGQPGDSRFVMIFEPDVDDEWDDPDVLRKVNPNIGVSVSEAYLLDQLEQARASASLQNAYRTKHLNQWVGAKVAWMNMLAWQRQKRTLDMDDFKARPAFLGIDLASKKDVAAVAILTSLPDGNHVTFQRFYAPESAAEDNEKYRRWERSGHMVLTPGAATDYATIEADIAALADHFDVRGVAFDNWQAQYLAQRLMERGLPMEEFPHQVRTMSDPMKELEAMVLDDQLVHDGNPVMTEHMGYVAAKADAKDNIYPNKSNPNDPRCKIDGVVALIMAVGLMTREREMGSLDDWLTDPVAM